MEETSEEPPYADKPPFYIIFGIVINVLFIVFIMVVNYYGSKEAEIPDNVEEIIFMQRFFNSADCFTYNDGVRTYPGILDWEKFSNEKKDKIMADCFNVFNEKYERRFPAFRLTLKIDEFTERTVETKNWGLNFGIQHKKTKHVLVYSNNKFISGKLEITMWYV